MNAIAPSPSTRTHIEALLEQYRTARPDDKVLFGVQIMGSVRSGVYEGALEGEALQRFFVHGVVETEAGFKVVYSPIPTGVQKRICLRAFDRYMSGRGSEPPRFRLVADE